MNNQSTQDLTSIIVNSAIGGNKVFFQETLERLQKKPRLELLQGICSIIIIFETQGINGCFMKSARQIFNTLL
ncbi:MAG: hypothetical protein PHZ04_03015 [Patescibacteria group bacterium]|nr:hypothetical protein [Patescibacteria group bacterium]